MRHSRALTLTLLLLSACAPAVDSPPRGLEEAPQAIRNGTREPVSVTLREGQKLAIGWLHRPGSPAGNFCTGTLISPRVVITAEHCTNGEPPERFAFGVGLDPDAPEGSFNVIEIVEHPQVDAAMLILEGDVVARLPQLEPIAFNRAELNAQHQGMTAEAAGYGETFDASRDGRWFAALELETVGSRYLVVNGNGQRGICFGDSGGPLLAMSTAGAPVVLAVESNGEESCLGRDNMTRLDVLGPWIEPIAEHPGSSDPVDGASTNPCRQLDYLGRCNGAQAEWCEEGAFKARDCSAEGLGCGFVSDDLGYYCIDPSNNGPAPEPEPECTAEDTWCDGEDRVACAGGSFVRERCAVTGATCGFSATGAPTCVDASGNSVNPEPDDLEGPDAGGFVEEPAAASAADQVITSRCSVSPRGVNLAPLLLLGLAALLRRR